MSAPIASSTVALTSAEANVRVEMDPDRIGQHRCAAANDPFPNLRRALTWISTRDEANANQRYLDDLRSSNNNGILWSYAESFLDLSRAAKCGDIVATFQPSIGDRNKIPRLGWIGLELEQHGRALILYRRRNELDLGASFRPEYRDVLFDRSALRSLWPPASKAVRACSVTMRGETTATALLVEIMLAAPMEPIAKKTLRDRSEFRGLPKRMFDRAYINACEQAKTPAWRAPGRRPSRAQQNAAAN